MAASRRGSLTAYDDEGRALSAEIAPSARRSYLFRAPIGGGRFGFFPDHGLLYCEGRAASLHAGAVAPARLLPHRYLSHAATRAALEFEQLGLPLLFEPAVVRRLDLAVELGFADPPAGVRFMHALSGVPLPRLKTDVWLRDGRVETIYYRTLGRGEVRFRIYDKGVESGTAEPGARIRLERQLRYLKADQLPPEVLAGSDLGRTWEGELRAWAGVTVPVRPSGLQEAQEAVVRAARAGLPALEAERLLGWLALRQAGLGREWWVAGGKRHIPSRREADLRTLGIALDDAALSQHAPEPVEIDLRALLGGVRSAWAATASASPLGRLPP